MQRVLLPALVAAAALVTVGSAFGATTTIGPYGTTMLDGHKVFPIVLAKGPERGAKTPTGADALDEVVGAGVNFFKVGPASRPWWPEDKEDALAWDREAATRGAYTWVNLATLADARPGTLKDTRLREVIALLKGDPSASALAMWKGADEPWWGPDFQPADLQYAYCVATSRGNVNWCEGRPWDDSEHLWVTIQAPKGTAADLAPYSAVTDIHGVDHYPVTYGNSNPELHEIGTWTDTIASVTPSQAVWTTLQVCASGSNDPSTGEFVLPTHEQERYMIYDAIINGARSLAFYGGNINRCWTPEDTRLGWNWTFWDDVLEGLVREISALSPIAPALVNPETTQVLTTSDATVQAISRVGATKDDLWVIAASHGDASAQVTISGLPSWASTATAYTEGRTVAASGGSLTDTFDRWAVHVYHFHNEPPAPPPAPAPPPPAPAPPPPAPPAAPAAVLAPPYVLVGRTLTTSGTARAGRIFTLRFRVDTLTGPADRGAVRCTARAGRTALRPTAKRWTRGLATCAWRLPKTSRGKLLRASIRVDSRGKTVTRSLIRRVRR